MTYCSACLIMHKQWRDIHFCQKQVHYYDKTFIFVLVNINFAYSISITLRNRNIFILNFQRKELKKRFLIYSCNIPICNRTQTYIVAFPRILLLVNGKNVQQTYAVNLYWNVNRYITQLMVNSLLHMICLISVLRFLSRR